MLLSDVANRNRSAVKVEQGNTKDAFSQENPFGVVTERTMPEVGEERFGFVEPIMNGKIVFGLAAESPRAVLCVCEWMCHN